MINRLYLVGIIVVLMLGIGGLVKYVFVLKEERNKYQSNTYAMLSDIKRMRIDSTTTAVDVKTLRLTIDEYKQYRAEDAQQIKKLGIRIKSLQAVGKHQLEVSAPIQASIRDTTIIRDTTVIRLKSVEMNTPHIQLSGIIESNKLIGNINLPVTLHQAVWVEPKYRFLWWRWGVKAVHQTISSDNPYVEVKYSEWITIQK